ncbi:DUF1415 domain-containing protein [Chitinophaga barathri]|uniref:DUF1415 domain-containing protein n=1 Tax=Chitinophaga barathri TaxID=1647451 RepID=A0A3N4MI80_9BACT|nr:DUF1415 domain-containing protein [Chitinophaga barathri]RPD41497.1 DUF1415 domain-containing protein [Chitinophaga barathri]
MDHTAEIITRTRNWIKVTVIGCNFCPFAAREVRQDSVHYEVAYAGSAMTARQAFLNECIRLDKDSSIGTTLLIFPDAFPLFADYLDLVKMAEEVIRRKKYTGIYQVAGFHPLYQFADTTPDDAANYTNRSIYPMLHLLREDAVHKAIKDFPNPEGIPARNIDFARRKGEAYMKLLRDSCW